MENPIEANPKNGEILNPNIIAGTAKNNWT